MTAGTGEAVTRSPGVATWDALGTYVDLRVSDPERIIEAEQVARAVLDEVDRTCSRFRADSDLSRANGRPGRWTEVSPTLVDALRAALRSAAATDGLVDPTLGGLLVAAGYDRTFARIRVSRSPVDLPGTGPGWKEVDVGDGAVRVPPGASLDLGATGKAYAADLVADTVAHRLRTGVVVSVGGDVAVAPPGHACGQAAWPGAAGGWPVAVRETYGGLRWTSEDTRTATGQGPTQVVLLVVGGLATSTTLSRRWRRGGRGWHHIFDPRTGRPARSCWRTVSAVGHDAVAANTASTAGIILGDDALDWLSHHDVAARLVDRDGHVVTTGSWPAPVPDGGERA